MKNFTKQNQYRIDFPESKYSTFCDGHMVKKTLNKYKNMASFGVRVHDVTHCDEMTRIDKFENLVYSA